MKVVAMDIGKAVVSNANRLKVTSYIATKECKLLICGSQMHHTIPGI